jgi:arginine repressor
MNLNLLLFVLFEYEFCCCVVLKLFLFNNIRIFPKESLKNVVGGDKRLLSAVAKVDQSQLTRVLNTYIGELKVAFTIARVSHPSIKTVPLFADDVVRVICCNPSKAKEISDELEAPSTIVGIKSL